MTPRPDVLTRARCSLDAAQRCKAYGVQATFPIELMTELIAELERARGVEITTAAELDALPIDSVVVDVAGIQRAARHGDSHMAGGWTHAGRSPLKSRELADGRPMRVVWRPD